MILLAASQLAGLALLIAVSQSSEGSHEREISATPLVGQYFIDVAHQNSGIRAIADKRRQDSFRDDFRLGVSGNNL